MLVFDGVIEMEISVFGEIAGAGDPQPVIDIKATARAKEMSLTRQRNEFMLALRRYRGTFLIEDLNPFKIHGDWCSLISGGIRERKPL
jgi:hypothetical protein